MWSKIWVKISNIRGKISQSSVQRNPCISMWMDILRRRITDWRKDITKPNNCSSQMLCESSTNRVVLCRRECLDVSFWTNFTENVSWKLKFSNILGDLKLQQLRCEKLKSQHAFYYSAVNYCVYISRSTLQTHRERQGQGVKNNLGVYFVEAWPCRVVLEVFVNKAIRLESNRSSQNDELSEQPCDITWLGRRQRRNFSVTISQLRVSGDVTSCTLVDRYQFFVDKECSFLQPTARLYPSVPRVLKCLNW